MIKPGTHIRKCQPQDLPQLLEFALTTFLTTYEHLNDPVDFQNYVSKSFTLAKFQSEMTSTGSAFYFLELDSKVIGYIKLNEAPYQSGINDPLSIEVERAYIAPQYHSLGYGKMLFDFILNKAKALRKEYIWLGVWEMNEMAIAFYKKLGFVKFAEHPFKMGSANQKDYLMCWDLTLPK